MKLSSASKRAQKYPENNGEWFCEFNYTEISGLGYEEGVHRRDPSSIIKVNGLYYVWYTKSVGPHYGKSVEEDECKRFPWDYGDIYYATSRNGIEWIEQGCAVHRGGKGAYDERTVCTPDIFAHKGNYYLVYQAVSQGTYTGYNENVAMAVAEQPNGPFIKLDKSILKPREDGRWFEGIAYNNYNDDTFGGSTHDPSLFYYNKRFYLYYKCGASRPDIKNSGYDTRWGVAISDDVTGPYEASPFNPLSNSGHEPMMWNYNGGIAALLNRDGPEKNTIQYAEDGINFNIMSYVNHTPQAGGVYKTDNADRCPLEGVRWGLCHCDERVSKWNYIARFDIEQSQRTHMVLLKYPLYDNKGID